jgi:hypothetical protein
MIASRKKNFTCTTVPAVTGALVPFVHTRGIFEGRRGVGGERWGGGRGWEGRGGEEAREREG